MLLRDALDERARRDTLFVFDREVLRNKDVDAVGLTVDMIVDPFQLEVKLIDRESGRSKHSETAGSADSSHHVAAVAEGHQREIDAEHFANGCFHSDDSLRS